MLGLPASGLKIARIKGTQSVHGHAIRYHFLADLHVTRRA